MAKKNWLEIILRSLLGLGLLAFGFTGIFFPQMPPYTGAAAQMLDGLMASGYFFILHGIVLMAVGIMLLANRLVPLALILLAPLTINWLLFHIFLDFATIWGALIITLIQLYLVHLHWKTFKPLVTCKK